MRLGRTIHTVALLAGLTIVTGTKGTRAEQASGDEGVKAVEAAFYAALSARDIHAMENVWAREPYIVAVHPVSKMPNIGWAAVRKSFEAVFDRYSELSVSPKEPHLHIEQGVAWDVGSESVRGRLKNGDSVSFTNLMTNIFEKQGDHWVMVEHHASRMPE